MVSNTKIIDAWTFIHALVAFNIGSITKSRPLAYSLIVGYEAIENKYLDGTVFKDTEGMLNVLSDIVVGIGTYELGKKYGQVKI